MLIESSSRLAFLSERCMVKSVKQEGLDVHDVPRSVYDLVSADVGIDSGLTLRKELVDILHVAIDVFTGAKG